MSSGIRRRIHDSFTAANTTFIGLDDEGGLCVYTSGSADLLMDVFGWFTTDVSL